jgi:hypothetical protein
MAAVWCDVTPRRPTLRPIRTRQARIQVVPTVSLEVAGRSKSNPRMQLGKLQSTTPKATASVPLSCPSPASRPAGPRLSRAGLTARPSGRGRGFKVA